MEVMIGEEILLYVYRVTSSVAVGGGLSAAALT